MSYEHFVELLKDQVQIAALAFMTLMYVIKIVGIMKKTAIGDRTPKRGDLNAGMRYAFMTIAMPWDNQTYKQQPLRYVEFAVFHLGIAAAIGATFLIPYFPEIMLIPAIGIPAIVLCYAGLVCGVCRLIRRLTYTPLRLVSSPDDFFSIMLLNAYLLLAALAIPYSEHATAWQIVAFFSVTTFFLIYVPFSKISHYILWPFNRYLIGKHFGKRGVYPKLPQGSRT